MRTQTYRPLGRTPINIRQLGKRVKHARKPYKTTIWTCSRVHEYAMILPEVFPMTHLRTYHTDTEEIQLPSGFSWPLFLLGPFYTGYLGDVHATVLIALLYLPMLVLVVLTRFTGIFGFWLLNLPFACTYHDRLVSLYKKVGFSEGPLPLPKPKAKRPAKVAKGDPWSDIDQELDKRPSSMWVSIPLYGSSKPEGKSITIGKKKVPLDYGTLCGFLCEKEDLPAVDILDKGATIAIKISGKQVWSYTAETYTHLIGKTFSLPVEAQTTVTVVVKKGFSNLDNIRLVLV